MYIINNERTGDLDIREEAIRGGRSFFSINPFFWGAIFYIRSNNALFYLLLVDFFEQIQQQILESCLITTTYHGTIPSPELIEQGYGLNDVETRTYISSTRRLIGRGIGMGLCLLGSRYVGVPAFMFFMVSIAFASSFYIVLIWDYAVDGVVMANDLRYYCTYLFGVSTGFYYAGFMPMLGNERVNYTRNSRQYFEFRHYLTVSTLGLLLAFVFQVIIRLFVSTEYIFLVSVSIALFCELVMFYCVMRAYFLSSEVTYARHWLFFLTVPVIATVAYFVPPGGFIAFAEIASFVIFGFICIWIIVMDRRQVVHQQITEYRPWLALLITILASILFGLVRMFFYRENSLLPRIILPAESDEDYFNNTLYSATPFLFFLFPGLWLSYGVGQRFNIVYRFLALLFFSAIGFFMIAALMGTCYKNYLHLGIFMLWTCYMEFSLGLFFAEAMNITYMFIPTSMNPGLWLGITYEIQYIVATSLTEIYCHYTMPVSLSTLPIDPNPSSAIAQARHAAINEYMYCYAISGGFIMVLGFILFPLAFPLSRMVLNTLDRFAQHGGRDNYWNHLNLQANQTIVEL